MKTQIACVSSLVLMLAGCAGEPPKDVQRPMPPSSIVEVPGDAYNRLHIGTVINLPGKARTVAAALRHVLEPTGYVLVSDTYITQRPLPPMDFDGRVLTVEEALLKLIGDENGLVIDHAHRKLAVERLLPGAVSRVVTRAVD